MFNKSFFTITTGIVLMIIASALFYFDFRSLIAFICFGLGFVFVGVGILMGFAKMIQEDK